jgi:4-amino-4-deoxy-L-arabinose transferase-like glycosyltransferase
MGERLQEQMEDWGRYFDKRPISAWSFAALWICLIGGIAFLLRLGSTGLVDETEPLFAEAARQMTVTGDWVTPYFNGQTRFDKPPLIYWLMAIFYKSIGVNEWAVRLPSALSAIALMGMGFYLLCRYGTLPASRSTTKQFWLSALIGSALIALHPSTLIWARTGVSDMLLSGCLGLTLMCFFCGYAEASGAEQQNGRAAKTLTHPPSLSRWYLAFYIFVALAILAKGPIGLVLPGLIIGSFSLYLGNWRAVWQELRPLWGIGIVLAIALPWFILVTLANGEAYIDSFFGYHNLERFTQVVNNHRAPWYFYFGVVLVGFAPWSIFLPVAIARLQFWQRSIWQHQPRSAQLGLFAWFWFACIFGFFTVATTKLPSYVLPLMPAAAILVALYWNDWITQPSSRWGVKVSSGFNVLLFLLLAGLMVYSPRLLEGGEETPNLAAMLQSSGLPLIGATIAAVTAVAILCLLLRRQLQWVWFANLISLLALTVVVLLPASTIVDSERQLPLRQLSETIAQTHRPGEEIVMIGTPKPTVVFYSHQPVFFRRRIEAAAARLREIAQNPEPPTVLVLAFEEKLNALKLPPSQYQILRQAGPYTLTRISKAGLK